MAELIEDAELEYTGLSASLDEAFTNEERVSNFLNITSDKFTRVKKSIKLTEVGLTDPVKTGRQKTIVGLTQTIKELGVLVPIQVMAVPVEAEEDDYKYILIDGLRRYFGAVKNSLVEIDAVVWDFNDKEQGMDLLLPLGLFLNRTQKRSWSEIWDLYRILEMQSSITPGTLEYLLQLDGGDAMKLKDVMLCEYVEVREVLLSGEKSLEMSYRMLQKLRREEDQLARDDSRGFSDTVENAGELVGGMNAAKQLSDADVLELLEMASDLNESIGSDDFNTLNSVADEDITRQTVGDRRPLDPALRAAVLYRDDYKCKCCGFGGAAALGILAVHHVIPVHVGGTDTEDNLVVLCLNHHILLHIAERNAGKLQMTQYDFDLLTTEEQTALKKTLKLAKVAVAADKRKGLTRERIVEETSKTLRHPMPGENLKETTDMFNSRKA